VSEKENKGRGKDQSAESKAKPNKGLDENTHVLVAPDGTEIEATQREFKDTYRAQGYVKKGEVAETDDTDASAPEAPVL
jgi:hypothetical protein